LLGGGSEGKIIEHVISNLKFVTFFREEGDRFERIGMTLSLVGAVLVLMDNSFHSYVFVDLSAGNQCI